MLGSAFDDPVGHGYITGQTVQDVDGARMLMAETEKRAYQANARMLSVLNELTEVAIGLLE